MIAVITVSVFFLSAVVCNRVARRRGAEAAFWTAMGLAFGPLAIPFVLFSKGGVSP